MKLIQLNHGKVAKVDDGDFKWLSQWKWKVKRDRRRGLNWDVLRRKEVDGKRVDVKMSRLIMNAPKGVMVDHEDGDGLDNQRHNLRFANNTQNQHNQRRLRSDNTTGYKGVTVHRDGRFVAQIYVNKKHLNLGYFKTREQAARAYDAAAEKYFGEFAAPNKVMIR